MNTHVYARLSRRPAAFRSLTGMSVTEFERLYHRVGPQIIDEHLAALCHRERQRAVGAGGQYKNDVRNRLLLTLVWLRIYATYEVLGFLFDLDKSNVGRNMKPLLAVLRTTLAAEVTGPDQAQRQKMNLGQFIAEFADVVAMVDATEQPTQRPQARETQKKYYSGKKKRPTLKNQIIVTPAGEISQFSKTVPGSKHDKKLFEDSARGALTAAAAYMADKGYQGLQDEHKAVLPDKKPRGKDLTPEQKARNKRSSKARIIGERIIGKLKVYQVLSQKYRHARDSHDEVLESVAGLTNHRIRNQLAQHVTV